MNSKKTPFVKLFTMYYVVITMITLVIIVFIGIQITERFFTYYIDKVHEENQKMVMMKLSMHYMKHDRWDWYGVADIGEASERSGDYFILKDPNGVVIYTNLEKEDSFLTDKNIYNVTVEEPLLVNDETVGYVISGYFSNFMTSPEEDAFKKSSLLLIIISLIAISVIGAFISILFFYRLSKPINLIAETAKEISRGNLRSKIKIDSNVREMTQIADALNYLGESLLTQQKFRHDLTVELSHELRTPLQILLNQVEAILDKIYVADDEKMEAMHFEIIRIIDLLNELEDRLILENENLNLDIVQCDASEIIHRICVGYQGSFAKKSISFIYNYQENIILEMDKLRFSQLLINLLSNALKYTISGTVSLDFQKMGNEVKLIVTDTGVGIEQERLGDIFSKSNQKKDKNSRGVGLFIAKLIADKHGWAITVDSVYRMGTTITLHIKANRGDA